MCELTPDQRASFSGSNQSPAFARSFVDGRCCPEHGHLARDALLLVTSELVTNAVLHGCPPITVQLRCHETEIQLTVGDASGSLPEEQGTSGRMGTGLRIVAGIAREWGTTPVAGGKEVWCRVPTGVVPAQRTPGASERRATQREDSFTHQP
jgi:hypothetical protein